MDYYGLLFLYYLKGLSGKSVLRLFFNIEAGGTEQLLPENTSTPTTTPILADIQYPDGLRTDQYFTYRETPTTVSNKARIKTIKGNTLVWNQLIPIPPTDRSTVVSGVTITDNRDGSLTLNGTANSNGAYLLNVNSIPAPIGHKFYVHGYVKVGSNTGFMGFAGLNIDSGSGGIWTNTLTYTSLNARIEIKNGDIFNNTKIIPQYFDLTKMFGLGNEPTIEEFKSLFPLNYYAYNSGSLLNFNGTGIKTVGKNLFDQNSVLLSQGFVKQNDGSYYRYNLASLSNALVWNNDAHINGAINIKYQYKYTNGTGSSGLRPLIRYTDGTEKNNYPTLATDFTSFSLQTDPTKTVDKIVWDYGSSVNGTYIKDFIISIDNISYEPYTSSTLSLPISTYFPNGMKSAGTVYDELTESKAITRIGVLDLGSVEWTSQSTSGSEYRMVNLNAISALAKRPSSSSVKANLLCARYTTITADRAYLRTMGISLTASGGISIYDPSYNTQTSSEAFQTAMQGVYLYYELATETETPITTEDANEALSLLMGKSVSSSNANQMIGIITKGE